MLQRVYLERCLLVPDGLLEPCDVLLLVVDLLLRLGQVRLQLVVRVSRLGHLVSERFNATTVLSDLDCVCK